MDRLAGLESVAGELERVDKDGRAFWHSRTSISRSGAGVAYLLPAWDEYTVAYRDRTDVLDPKYATRVNAGGGVLKPVIVVRGEVVGSWQRTIAKGSAVIKPTLFKRLDRADWDAVEKAGIKYGRFLGLAAEVARG